MTSIDTTTRTTRLKAPAIMSALVFAVLGSSIAIITQQQQPTAYAQQQQQQQLQTFMAKLTGKAEVPPVDTPATGMVQFQLSSDGKEINYDLSATNLYEALLSPDFCNRLNHDFKDKHLWIKKATGLGVTEFFLRFMAWLSEG
jgi:uncharacterized membrane protein